MKQYVLRATTRAFVTALLSTALLGVAAPSHATEQSGPDLSHATVVDPDSTLSVLLADSISVKPEWAPSKAKSSKHSKKWSKKHASKNAGKKTHQKHRNKTKGRHEPKKRPPRPAPSVSFRERAVQIAAAQAGDPYVYGATGPNAFDCSGLTSFSFAGAGHPIPRTSSAQRAAVPHVSASDRQRGDLVFFHGSSGVYHVGIYAGDNAIWHAPSTGSNVQRAPIWTSSISYGRVH